MLGLKLAAAAKYWSVVLLAVAGLQVFLGESFVLDCVVGCVDGCLVGFSGHLALWGKPGQKKINSVSQK